jgi:hypothetical protein
MSKNYDAVRAEIERKFLKNIKGKKPDNLHESPDNAGAEGDWLTRMMGLNKNGLNMPDYKGFEMKKCSAKISFGDWSPSYSLYSIELSRGDFLRIFGSKKNGRFSWSGSVFPKINLVTRGGQEIKADYDAGIEITYSYSKDKRKNKDKIVPERYRVENLILATWSKERLNTFISNKYGAHGYFILVKNHNGLYSDIVFGPPLNYNTFIFNFKKGIIFLDCGMVLGNPRQYMTFRANKDFWFKLATRRKKVIE